MTDNEFDTTDIVALYLGKIFGLKQMPKIKKIVEFLIGSSDNFGYENADLMNHLRQLLLQNKNLAWLSSLHYNRKDYENWMANIIKNHGATQTLVK